MYNKPESPLFGCRVFAFVHDEILMEAPLERAHEAAFELARIMVEAMKEWVPDVKISASPALMLAWSKDATMVKDKDGRLIPWVREIKK
jgi:DNA polymerase I-like protein with 3'-5' exonuclease and polymerase domains